MSEEYNPIDWFVDSPDPETWTREQLVTRVQWLQDTNLKNIAKRLKLEKRIEELERELNGYKGK